MGSASPFVFLIKSAGIEIQSSRKKFIKILKPVEIFKDDLFVKFLPYNGFKVTFQVDFQHPFSIEIIKFWKLILLMFLLRMKLVGLELLASLTMLKR